MSFEGFGVLSGGDPCPVCKQAFSGSDTCPNCGFNRKTVAAGAPESLSSMSPKPSRPNFSGLLTIMCVLIAAGAGFYVAKYRLDLFDSVAKSFDLPEISDPIPEANYPPAKCQERMEYYLKAMFAATTNDAAQLGQLQIDAGVEFGVSSDEWKSLIDVYVSNSITASTEGPRKAFKKSLPAVVAACQQEG
jgi:hypothetical protein